MVDPRHCNNRDYSTFRYLTPGQNTALKAWQVGEHYSRTRERMQRNLCVNFNYGSHGKMRCDPAQQSKFKELGAMVRAFIKSKDRDFVGLCRKADKLLKGTEFQTDNWGRFHVFGFRILPNVAQWANDASDKFTRGEWLRPVWGDAGWWYDTPEAYCHALHVSVDDPTCVAYAENAAKLEAGRFTKVKPGRYLAKYFSDVLDDKQIKHWADKHVASFREVELKFARTEDDIIRAINLGPKDSCMTAGYHGGCKHWYRGHIHPAAIYATPDIEVAYFEHEIDGKVHIMGRAICNATKKTVARPYGDSRLLVAALHKAGYQLEAQALVGCRIRKILNKNSGGADHIMAYVDAGCSSGGGSLRFTDYDKDHWILTTGRGTPTSVGYDNSGVTGCDAEDENMVICYHCDEEVHEDDAFFLPRLDGYICDACRADNYVIAFGRRGAEDYYPVEDTVLCVTDDQYYVRDYANGNDVYYVEDQDAWYHRDDIFIFDGDWYLNDDAVQLDIETSDGETTAPDSLTVRTGDGLMVYINDTTTCAISGKVYHNEAICTLRFGESLFINFHPDSVLEYPHRFRVCGSNKNKYVLLTDKHYGYGLDELPREFVLNPPKRFENLTVGDRLYGEDSRFDLTFIETIIQRFQDQPLFKEAA